MIGLSKTWRYLMKVKISFAILQSFYFQYMNSKISQESFIMSNAQLSFH